MASASNSVNNKIDISTNQTLIFSKYNVGKYFFDIITSVSQNLEIVLDKYFIQILILYYLFANYSTPKNDYYKDAEKLKYLIYFDDEYMIPKLEKRIIKKMFFFPNTVLIRPDVKYDKIYKFNELEIKEDIKDNLLHFLEEFIPNLIDEYYIKYIYEQNTNSNNNKNNKLKVLRATYPKIKYTYVFLKPDIDIKTYATRDNAHELKILLNGIPEEEAILGQVSSSNYLIIMELLKKLYNHKDGNNKDIKINITQFNKMLDLDRKKTRYISTKYKRNSGNSGNSGNTKNYRNIITNKTNKTKRISFNNSIVNKVTPRIIKLKDKIKENTTLSPEEKKAALKQLKEYINENFYQENFYLENFNQENFNQDEPKKKLNKKTTLLNEIKNFRKEDLTKEEQ